MKKLYLLGTMCLMALSMQAQKTKVATGYTDLGLPSETIWKNFNATGFYTYDEAVKQFGSRLPSKAQWEELKAECQWLWTGNGYKVIGPNGKYIVLPAMGYCGCDGMVILVGSYGHYLSSTIRAMLWVLIGCGTFASIPIPSEWACTVWRILCPACPKKMIVRKNAIT